MSFQIPDIHAVILVAFLIPFINMQAEQLKFSHDRFFSILFPIIYLRITTSFDINILNYTLIITAVLSVQR
jgi:hypothetical protein